MKKIILYNNRIPLEAEATDGINSGTIQVENTEKFLEQAVDEFVQCPFERVKTKKLLLEMHKHFPVDKIIFKEKI